MKRITAVLASSALVSASLIGYDLASYAATGQSLILGKKNTAGATTTVVSGKGAALSLVTKPGKPPLKVNRKAKVGNLNADLLDGLDSAALRTRAFVIAVDPAPGVASTLHTTIDVPPGDYHASYSVLLSTTATSSVCSLFRDPVQNTAVSYGVAWSGTTYRSHQGGTVVSASVSDPLRLQCSASGPFNFVEGNDTSYVTLIPIDDLTARTASATARSVVRPQP